MKSRATPHGVAPGVSGAQGPILAQIGALRLRRPGVSFSPMSTGATPDLVLLGGRVWTAPGDAGRPTATAIAGGRIVATGSDEEIRRMAGSRTQAVDLGGRSLLPGFMDSHTHFIMGGFALSSVQLRDAGTRAAFVDRITSFVAGNRREWVTGGGWDHEAWGGALPTREWIDEVTSDIPVFVSRLDGHMSLANSRALSLAGVTDATPDPAGGTLVRDATGVLTGVLKDEAQSLVSRVIPARTHDELDRALDVATRHALERGVTFITDMGSLDSSEASWAGLETYRRAAAAGRLGLRAYALVPIADWRRMAQFIERHGRGDRRLMWGGVKGFVDGSLGSTTAWFYDPYEDDPSTTGLVVTDLAALRESILQADEAGLQVIVHAIGDRANDWLLDVFAEAVALHGPRDRRFRTEHAQHLASGSIGRFAAEDVIASVQPYHAIDDGRWAENRVGHRRIASMYPFRGLLDSGATVAFGSDWTVAPLDPLLGIYAAVTRRTIDGNHPQGWVPEQRISVEGAVQAYTANNAYACFREGDLGAIRAGKLADLVVLSNDLFAIDPTEIEQVKVDMTIVGGEVGFER